MRTLEAFFLNRVVQEDQEARISAALADKESVPAYVFRRYATKTDSYLTGFEKHEHIGGARPGSSFYRKRAVEVLIEWLEKGKKKEKSWLIYRQAAILFLERELPKLNTLMLEVSVPDAPGVVEALKLTCSRAWEYDVTKEDILRFYEVWGFERIEGFESSIDDWIKPDEHVVQRRQIAAVLVAISDLRQAVADGAAEAVGLRKLLAAGAQTEAEIRSALTVLGDTDRKLEESVDGLADEVQRGAARLSTLEQGSRGSVAASTLAKEVQRMEASTKAAIDGSQAAVADALSAELSRVRDALEGEIRELSAKLSKATPTAASFGAFGAQPPPFASGNHSSSQAIKDVAAFRRALISAARARGVEASLMLQIHAAVAAGLTPVTLGPASLAALAAYADGACGGRLLIIHVAPSALLPRDLEYAPGAGLMDAAGVAKDIDGLSLVVLEGANRSPLEGSVVPLLQLMQIGLSPIASVRGLRIAATFVDGATTVPVSSQMWSCATAVYPEHATMRVAALPTSGSVPLSSDLLVPGDEPTHIVDALVESWPHCRELRPAMARLGAALTRFYDVQSEEPRIAEALLNGIVLPYVATSLNVEEQAEALNTAKDDGGYAKILGRLRRRLC